MFKILSIIFICSSCSTIYYNFWETLGQEKRDLLKSQIEKVNDSQSEVKEEFKDTLDKIRSEYKFTEGKLEKTYDEISDDYDDVKEESDMLSKRIDKTQAIATDLFKEWKKEAYELTNSKYRKISLNKLNKTKRSFNNAMAVMRKVEKKLSRTLRKLNDQVIFIKHNLNAKIVGNLQTELKSIEGQMKSLIKDIDFSISKAKGFIQEIK